MKNLKFLFFSFLLVAFLAPSVVNAQKVKLEVPAALNFTLNTPNPTFIFHDEGRTPAGLDAEFIINSRVKITPSGNCQVKCTFDAAAAGLPVPIEGKIVIPVDRFAVLYERASYAVFTAKGHHFVASDAVITVRADGTAKVVYNWEASEATGYSSN